MIAILQEKFKLFLQKGKTYPSHRSDPFKNLQNLDPANSSRFLDGGNESVRAIEHKFFVGCLILAMVKILLISDLEIFAIFAPHDHLWFIRAADQLIKHNWLGDYDPMTLIRPPGYPIWIS